MRSPDMSTAERESLAHRIANDREEGFSGAALRAKYGEWLTGPNRRVLLRESGRDDLIGASYVTFRDGQPRKGFARAQATNTDHSSGLRSITPRVGGIA